MSQSVFATSNFLFESGFQDYSCGQAPNKKAIEPKALASGLRASKDSFVDTICGALNPSEPVADQPRILFYVRFVIDSEPEASAYGSSGWSRQLKPPVTALHSLEPG